MKAIRVSEYGGPSARRWRRSRPLWSAPTRCSSAITRSARIRWTHTCARTPTIVAPSYRTRRAPTRRAWWKGGPGVTTVKAGDRVYIGATSTGAYAELSVCEFPEVHPLPANVSFAQGAAVNAPYATAYHALFHRAHGEAGETVLVHGASGGVGIGAVQLARTRGLTVIATAGTERGRRIVLEQGAHHALDHTAPGYLDELPGLTGGRGPDIILEMLANVNLQKDLGVIALRGRIVVIGNRGNTEINARLAMNKNAAILGMALFHATPVQLAGIHGALVEGLRNGTLRPVIGHELPLAQAARAHEVVMEAGHTGKVVLIP